MQEPCFPVQGFKVRSEGGFLFLQCVLVCVHVCNITTLFCTSWHDAQEDPDGGQGSKGKVAATM